MRVRDAGHRIGHARAGRDDDDADPAREPRVRIRRMRGRLLVPHVDQTDSLAEASVVDRQHVPSAEREHVADSRILQRAGHKFSACELRHVSVLPGSQSLAAC